MSLKLIGSIIIFICCIVLGKKYSKTLSERTNNLKSLNSFAIKLKEQLITNNYEFPVAIESAMKDMDFYLKDVFCEFIKNVESKKYKNYCNAFDDGQLQYLSKYSKKDMNLISSMIQTIDLSGFEGIIQAIDKFICSLEECIADAANFETKSKKLYFNIWIYGGILAIVLMV